MIFSKPIDKHRCVAYNIDERRWEVTNLDLNEKKIATIFKLLTTGEKCACKLLEEINITQPTLSHHMKILCDSGIVVGRKEGKWMHYSISPEGSETAVKYLKELTKITCLDADKSCCEK